MNFVLTSTAEAARALIDRWPVRIGKALEQAQRTCLAALEGKEGPEVAREAFIMAADEAGVYIR